MNSNSKLELENDLFDKQYINVSTGYYKHTEKGTHRRETLLWYNMYRFRESHPANTNR